MDEREVTDTISSGFIVEKRSEEVKTDKAHKPIRIRLQEIKDDYNKSGEKWVDLGGTSGIGFYLLMEGKKKGEINGDAEVLYLATEWMWITFS